MARNHLEITTERHSLEAECASAPCYTEVSDAARGVAAASALPWALPAWHDTYGSRRSAGPAGKRDRDGAGNITLRKIHAFSQLVRGHRKAIL